MHCGGASGMLPRDYYNADRDLHLQQSHVQEMLFEQWEKHIGAIENQDKSFILLKIGEL